MSNSVQVGIKFKPLVEQEGDKTSSTQWIVRGNSIVSVDPVTAKPGNNEFNFDHTFDMDRTNSNVFDSIVKPIIDAAIKGFNGTVFCYGQVDSGKTHTMIGTLEEPGIIPLSIQYIFKAVSNTIGREFLLRVSYVEIYNETINDLLNKNGLDLKLHKDDSDRIIIDSKEEIVNTSDSMLSIMKKGIQNQKIKRADSNEYISSHNIFQITIESQSVDDDSQNVVLVSQLNLVDLAGFKRTCGIDAIEGQQMDTSLFTLVSVIMQLSEIQNDQRNINYRESKLTELLQQSLGGNSLTAIICTVTAVALEETHETLSFASRAKNVKNKPQKNEVVSDASLLMRYAKQLIKLETELQRIRNGNSSVERENIEPRLQEKYQINHVLEERIKLLKTQIVSGYNANRTEQFKCKSRRKQYRCNPGMFKQYLPVFQTKSGLPTIKEASPEKPHSKNNSQLVDVINQTLQTPFADFELDLIECETDYEIKENGNKNKEKCIKYINSVVTVKSKNSGLSVTPEKQDTYVQTSSNQGSPTTPKNTLRGCISELTKDLMELREFTTLEKQLICEEYHCGAKNQGGQAAKQSDLFNSKDNEVNEYSSNVMLQLEEEKAKLEEGLELKIQELDEIKNDIQGLKQDVEKLQKTIYLLTNENMEMSSKLCVEKERSKQAEINLQIMIDELHARISKVTNEKINLESDLIHLNDQLKSARLKILEKHNDEELLQCQNKLELLKSENIELSVIIAEKNKELESIKESKSLLYDHECIYKDKVQLLTEKNEYLVIENSELSTDLMDKIEENDKLREQCNTLKNKISLTQTTDFDENDIEQLRTENRLLKGEIMELKDKVTMLTDENVKFSNTLLETIENFDNSRNEKLSNNASYLSTVLDDTTKVDETAKEMLQEESREVLANKVLTLQDEINHLTRLNTKLSDLKFSSCNQCAHLKNLNESRRVFKLEAKSLTLKLEDLQRKFDLKCADTELLKMKVNQELNLSYVDGSLNASFTDGLNVSFVEEKVQHLNNELQTLKDDRDKLSILYKEKCDEFEKLHDEVDDTKPKKNTVKTTTRIEQIENSIDQLREDIDVLKKNNIKCQYLLNKFKMEKTSLLDQIKMLNGMNEELQQKVSNTEMAVATATEKTNILENELSNMSKEIKQYSEKEKIIQSEKLTLEVEVEELKSEKQNKDILIVELHHTIDDLNKCISSLKDELDLITNQRDELDVCTKTIEDKHKNEVELLGKQYEELEKEGKEGSEAEQRAILCAKELESDVEKLQTDLTKQENLYKELQGKVSQLENLLQESENEKATLKQELQELEIQLTDFKDNLVIKYKNELESEKTLINDNKKLTEELNTVKESMITELKSLKYKVNSVDFLNKTANDIFIIFLHSLISKEKEIVKAMRESFEKDKEKLEDEKRQSADGEKRAVLWSNELEIENEKLQMDLTKHEKTHKQQQDNIYQLERRLKESDYEKESLREKIQTLEIDFNNLQGEFDKQSKARQEKANTVVQKREKEAQDAFKKKEIELQSKIKSEKTVYEKKIEDLASSIESYKTKNMELKSNVEGLEANHKQLKNIIEANASELKINNQTIHRLTTELEKLTEAYNEVNRESEQKATQIEKITALLKSKCDMLSEYKAKYETIIPDYELLKDQVKEWKTNINRYKEEIQELKMENEKQIEIIKDKLNSEEIQNVELNKQLHELNNKNIALVEELDGIKEKYEELQHVNAKLEKKIRNSTSKMKAEAEMDDLRDLNKRLQNNLEGASNRITELQDNKNKILKELVNLKGQYETLSQENAEIKKTLSSYKSRQSIPCLFNEDSKYDALVQEKNKLALELEGNKLLINQRDKEIIDYVDRIKALAIKNEELDKQLEDHIVIVRERDLEITNLKEKLYVHQIENKLVNELEEKLEILKKENKKLQDQLETFIARPQIDMKQLEDIKLHNDKVCLALRKENLELQTKLNEYEIKLESKSNSSGSRSTSPAFEMNRRRQSRTEVFNQKRQIENVMFETDINENEEMYQVFRKRIQELELELVTKNGQIATLEIQIQSENFPYQQKCKELEELLLSFRQKNAELRSEIGKLKRAMYDINAWECDTCRKWRINRRDQACQTIRNNSVLHSSTANGAVNDHAKVMKLEKEKELIKDICRSRCRRIKELEDKVKELEDTCQI
ncbi:kinesin-like protein KIN-7O isoform X3 [Colletes gigas]|uniref:kinesin-like protein KIN-7O isoform X3 n=1 Tax=Colletes gigas TaxID=935657 RepID=UPI001C9A715C|nr:kinesin-like protein KIN-7O isoform X3 [Colletes gigas]